MTGDTHCLVAQLALNGLSEEEQHILAPRWGGIEAGATLSDHFRIMWEPESLENQDKQLVHRCYIDSSDSKNHGCITRALDYSEGTASFAQDYMDGQLEGVYTEEEFLENLGMFLGVASHHIADLCTPVHVGHKIDFEALGQPSLSRLHTKVERDIYRYRNKVTLELKEIEKVEFTRDYFWQIAKATYENAFVSLDNIYLDSTDAKIKLMVANSISSAVSHTRDTWHAILVGANMMERTWSTAPLE